MVIPVQVLQLVLHNTHELLNVLIYVLEEQFRTHWPPSRSKFEVHPVQTIFEVHLVQDVLQL